MKCEYCSKEMDDNAIKCPNCNSWIPEINKMQNKYYELRQKLLESSDYRDTEGCSLEFTYTSSEMGS